MGNAICMNVDCVAQVERLGQECDDCRTAPLADPGPGGQRKGDWMQTASGRQYWPLDPRPEDVDADDIAHHLSLICRFNGAVRVFYSVAEHSVGVLEVLEKDMQRHGLDIDQEVARKYRLAALLHDGSEAYCHDIIRPVKRHLPGYREVEAANMGAISDRFGLPLLSELDEARIKHADNAMLLAEQAVLMAPSPHEWAPLDVPQEMLRDALAFVRRHRGEAMLSPADAKAMFRAELFGLLEQ